MVVLAGAGGGQGELLSEGLNFGAEFLQLRTEGIKGFLERLEIIGGETGFLGFDAEVSDGAHGVSDLLHFGFAETTGSHGGGAEADARRTESGALISWEGISIQSEANLVEGILIEFAVNTTATLDVDKDKVILGATTLKDEIMRF